MTSTAVNALYVLALQVIALATLAPTAFGAYSIQYLTYAFAASVTLSVLSEAWLRTETSRGYRSSWSDYSGVLLYLSVAAGLVTMLSSWLVPSLHTVVWQGTVAVAASTYRSGARYHAVRLGFQRYVLVADCLGIIVTLLVWGYMSVNHQHSLTSMVYVWAAGAVAAAGASRRPVVRAPSIVRLWFGEHKKQIRPLLQDSLLLDIGSIGTPYLLAPMLGLSNFGTYRAVSNVAAPVRLVLTPLRPILSAMSLTAHRSLLRGLSNLIVAVTFGIGAFAFLTMIGNSDISLGSLNAIVPFAVPTGIYVSANLVGHYYYIVARGHSSGRALFMGRVIQTVLVTFMPIGAALIGGIHEVIWAYAAATVLWSMVWVVQVLGGELGRD